MELPPVPSPTVPTPAECLRKSVASTPESLSTLPAGFKLYTPQEQARTLVRLKAADAAAYLVLRATALRCAPET